jgi:hypothetical protein
MATGKPVVVVSRRTKLADVYMFLRRVPHADISDRELRRLVRDGECDELSESQINIIRGERGRPNLFVGLSVSDVSVDSAMALAPLFLGKARTLVAEGDTSH